MFELFLARVCATALTGQISRRRSTGLTALPARFMPFILRAFSLFVAGSVAPSCMAAPTGNTRLEAGYS
jgi:hypothetical protein